MTSARVSDASSAFSFSLSVFDQQSLSRIRRDDQVAAVRRGLDVADDFDVSRLKELAVEQFVLIHNPSRRARASP